MIEIKEKISLITLISSLVLVVILLATGFKGPTGYVISNETVQEQNEQVNQQSCADSDGSDYTIKGTVRTCVNGECTTNEDSCSGNVLKEWSCENNEKKYSEKVCESICDSGACAIKANKFSYTGGGSTGGGGGSGTSTTPSTQIQGQTFAVGEIDSEKIFELNKYDVATFTKSGNSYSIILQDSTPMQATLSLGSTLYIISVGNIQQIDLNSDGNSDISLKIRSISTLNNNKVKISIWA